ncbi:MAG: hypothetical protein M1547_06415 [Gammaproteobacteria bacterium]|nr:hypothetical protein [Gammaproteobacteria bacterium]
MLDTKLKKKVLLAALVAVVASPGADAQPPQGGGAGAVLESVKPPPPAVVNAVTQTAVSTGVLACAGRINQVSSFLGYTPQAGALLMTPSAQPDQRLIPLAMEVPNESGAAYVSASFAPNQANGCGATYDAVVYWPDKCDAVAVKQFAGLKKIGQLKKSIAVLDGGVATKVFLMPAGSGCLSIKKEVVL